MLFSMGTNNLVCLTHFIAPSWKMQTKMKNFRRLLLLGSEQKEFRMTKNESVIRYLDLASMPENLPYDTSHIMKELNITNDDISAYRYEVESELSLKPVEKRNIVVKQVIKPLLKTFGFSSGGLDWRREIDDSYLIIHMMNSQFNSIATGVSFRFHISASKKDTIKNHVSNQWAYNQGCDLNQFSFLPYCGMFSQYYSGSMYCIDGYKNYLASNSPIEDICRQLGEDFGKYILPELCEIKTYEDFLDLRVQKLKRYDEKEIRLLQYFYAVQSSAMEMSGKARDNLISLREKLELNVEDIAAHIKWLDVIRNNFPFTKVDAKELAIGAAKEGSRGDFID